MTWTAVGVWQGDFSTNLTLSNQGIGDLIVAEVINYSNSTVWCTGLSGGGVTWAAAGVKFSGTNNAFSAAVFLGTVTATGAGTATVSWSGTAPAQFGIASHEFTSSVGSWSFITQGNLDSAGGTANFPSLTAAAGDLYFGFAADATAATAGSTSGYTYSASADSAGNGAAYNVSCPSGATFPVWGDSGQLLGISVLVREGAAAAPADGPMGPVPPLPAAMLETLGKAPLLARLQNAVLDAPVVFAPTVSLSGSGTLSGNVPPYIAGLGGTGYNSWFQDQFGVPRLAVIEQGWALPFNAGRWSGSGGGATPQADFTSYFSNRAAQGYTAWYGVAWGSTHVDSTATGGKSWDGVFALTVNGTPGNIATGTETVGLNSTFWSRIDAMFATARQYGIACFLNMGLTYDFSDAGGIWQHATNTQATAFGTALATRYPQSSYPHVFWFFGDDDGGGNDSFWSAMLSGMASAGDTRPLIAIEYLTNENSHVEFDNGTAVGTFGASSATYNWCYSYDAPYFALERSYTEGGTFAHIPPVYGDGIYYGDSGGGPSVETAVRTFVWWALASGSRGFASTSGPSFGDSNALWMWASGAATGRVTSDPNGSWTTTNVGRIASYIQGLADWNKLIPDTSNVFITAGRGTRGTCDIPGSGFNVRTGNTYVAGSVTPGGTLAVIYCRASMSITIDQSKMNAGYTATWVDPSNPTLTQSATTGSTYASAGLGNNAAGQPDWVLVLQAPPVTAGSASLSGSGSLTASPQLAGTAALTGTGTLTAAPQAGATAALSGLGTLSVSGVTLGTTAALSGTGTLTASPQLTGSASLSGLGALTASPAFTGTGSLSGTGTLTASPRLEAAVSLSGSGTLTAVPGGVAGASLSGSGSLSAVWALTVPVTLSGSGTLSWAPAGTANLSGSGTLTAAPKLTGTAALTGTGTLTAASTQILAAAAALSGTGTLTPLWRLSVAAALSGSGTLTAIVHPPLLRATSSPAVSTSTASSPVVTARATSAPSVI